MKRDDYIHDRDLARYIVAGYDIPGFVEDRTQLLVRTADGVRGDALGCALLGYAGSIPYAFTVLERQLKYSDNGLMGAIADILRLPLNRANYLSMRHRPDLGITIVHIAHFLEKRTFFRHVPFNP